MNYDEFEAMTLAEMGDWLDNAERERTTINPMHCEIHSRAAHRAVDEEMRKLETNKRFRPGVADLWRFYFAWDAAFERSLDFSYIFYPEFCTTREMCDAHGAAYHAERLLEIADAKYKMLFCGDKRVKPPRKRRTVLVDGIRTKLEIVR
jgi:hypothetical protein